MHRFVGYIVSFIVTVAMASYAYAQSDTELALQRLQDRLNGIEKQLSSVQREVYRGGSPGKQRQAPVTEMGDGDEKIRAMNGKVEEMEHSIAVLTEKLDKIIADIDFRIAALETQNAVAKQQAASGGAGASMPIDTESEEKSGEKEAGGAEEAAVESPENTKEVVTVRYEQAMELFKQEKYQEAEIAFKNLIADNKETELVGNAYYWLAEIYYKQKNYSLASVNFLKGYQALPKGNKAPDNLFKLALSLKGLKKEKESCATLKKLKKEFPDGDKDLIKNVDAEIKNLKC